MNRSWIQGLYLWWCDGFCFVWDGTRHVPMVGNRCMVFHVLLTDITLDHAQRISIDPGEAVAWGSRTKFIYDNRFQTPELSLGRWWWRGMQKTEVWFSCSVVVFGRHVPTWLGLSSWLFRPGCGCLVLLFRCVLPSWFTKWSLGICCLNSWSVFLLRQFLLRLDVNMVYRQRLGPMLLVDAWSLAEYHWRRVRLCRKFFASIVTIGSSPSLMVVFHRELSARCVSSPCRPCGLHGREAIFVSCWCSRGDSWRVR